MATSRRPTWQRGATVLPDGQIDRCTRLDITDGHLNVVVVIGIIVELAADERDVRWHGTGGCSGFVLQAFHRENEMTRC